MPMIYKGHYRSPFSRSFIAKTAYSAANPPPLSQTCLVVERRDGSRVAVLANITPLFDEAGLMVGFMNAVQDQRFKERQAEEKASLKEALFQAQKMETIGQLTSGLV